MSKYAHEEMETASLGVECCGISQHSAWIQVHKNLMQI